LWEEAVITYQLDEDIKFVLKFQTKLQIYGGAKNKTARRAVGKAHWDKELKTATVILNRDAIAQNPHDMLEDTVPHEVAHIVCMIAPYHGVGHDQGWQEVCKRLGGSGHHGYAYGDYDMRIRKRRVYLYDVPGMGIRKLTDVKHRHLQSGNTRYRDSVSGLLILKEHWTGGVQ
jgi:predicted SprT family Zn-dependent metalloprotease